MQDEDEIANWDDSHVLTLETKEEEKMTKESQEQSVHDKDKQPLDLSVTGKMDDVKDINTLSLDARVIARDLQIIGVLLGQKWPETGPVKLNSSIVKKGKGIELNTMMTAGKTRINATTSIISSRGIPGISGRISAQDLFFPDLFEKKTRPAMDERTGKLSFFSREPLELDWLKKVDMDLLVDIASFDHEKLSLESARFKIDLDSGRLAIKSGKFIFPKGEITLDAHLELEKELKLSVMASAKEINPWHALSDHQTELEQNFNADLDIDIDITTSGANEYELFANMNGDLYILLKNGKIRKELLDMLFTDFIGWTVGKTIGKKYIDINCGVMDYRIKQGVISTNGFILDAKNLTIAGEGTIDLAKEQIAYVFIPKKKSRLVLNAEPVKVNGPLYNPTVTVIPWKSAVTTYGSLFFGPYVFAGLTAFNFLADTLNREGTISPCLAYEKKHHQDIKNAVLNQRIKKQRFFHDSGMRSLNGKAEKMTE